MKHIFQIRTSNYSSRIPNSLTHYRPNQNKDTFQIKTSKYSSRIPDDLTHYRPNQVTFGTNSHRFLGPQIWNCLPEELKSADNLNTFKSMITQWDGPMCNCNACRFIVNIADKKLMIHFNLINYIYLSILISFLVQLIVYSRLVYYINVK